ncbi:MAG: HPF/RaiA family ribosome-associated protein [Pseudomonadota bacterium]
MQVTPEITYKSFEPSERIRERVEHELRALESHYPRMISCKVVVSGGSGRRTTGDLARVALHVGMPGGKEVAVSKTQDDAGAHSDVMVAIRDAFQAAEKQLKALKPDPRTDGALPTRLAGTFLRKIDGEPAGFIRSEDGADYYVHAREATGAKFDSLAPGDAVTFRPDEGEKGPMARAVHRRGE